MLESSASAVAFALVASAAFFFWIPTYPRPATASTATPAIMTAANLPRRFPDASLCSSSRLSDSRLLDLRCSDSRLPDWRCSDLRCSDSRLSDWRCSDLRCSGSLSISDLISPSESPGSSFFSSYCSLHSFPTHFHDSGHSHTYFHNCNRNNIFLSLYQLCSAQLQAYVFHSFPTA